MPVAPYLFVCFFLSRAFSKKSECSSGAAIEADATLSGGFAASRSDEANLALRS
jgi:hypothetical protein